MKRGFTLLEVLVATTIMGIAVVGILSGISASMRNAARLSAYDRAVMLGRSKMDELLVDRRIPMGATVEGRTDDGQTGWAARFTPYDGPPNAGPGQTILERVELEIWWLTADGSRHTFPLEAYRRAVIPVPGI